MPTIKNNAKKDLVGNVYHKELSFFDVRAINLHYRCNGELALLETLLSSSEILLIIVTRDAKGCFVASALRQVKPKTGKCRVVLQHRNKFCACFHNFFHLRFHAVYQSFESQQLIQGSAFHKRIATARTVLVSEARRGET